MCSSTTSTFVLSALVVLAVLWTSRPAEAAEQKTSIKNDVCEYDIDLKRNTFHAKCQGQPLGVNVYANSASVTTGGGKGSKGPGGQFPSGGGGQSGGGHTMQLPFPMPPTSAEMDNTTRLLRTIREKLQRQKVSIANTSQLLSRGDGDLRSDLEGLRGLSAGDSSVREIIIATMRNQYNFMRTAILAHNADLNRMLDLLGTLVGMTTQARQLAVYTQKTLQGQLLHVNRTMLAMRSTFSSCLKKCHHRGKKEPRKKSQCPRAVSAFGSGDKLTAPWEQGVVLTDSTTNSDKMWVIAVTDKRDLLLQYNYREDLPYNVVSRYISLPFDCEGTGHVVYRNALFCHKSGSRTLIKYNLKRMEISTERDLPSAGVGNIYPYQSGLHSDIDLAVDELGLWVIYSTKDAAGKMVISKLHPRTLEIEKTWLTSFPKKMVGNSFMICGVLYATNSYQDTPTFIRYIYDTNTQQEAKMDAGNLVFNNAVNFNSSKQASSVMLQYNSNEQKLYSWSKGQIQTFPVYFKTD
ncbi:noelin-like isoform X2 [Babylonia areolata]|uniref:noelin-like isoform X2 n=1 Tax=Babylonia areolata TaxID=304850 RepID=UPI003FD1642A